MVSTSLAPNAPPDTPPNLYRIIDEMYTQIFSLVQQLNQQRDIVMSPNGHYWKLKVSNTGVVSATDLGTVLPP